MTDEPIDSGDPAREAHPDFFIVGIGASAGGVSALRALFTEMPTDIGMAFVVILHMSPQHESNLPALIQNQTRLPVTQITETVTVESNHVYVIPPSKYLMMMDGNIRLTEPERLRGGHTSIDLFFRTLATAYGKNAIAILLSGTGTDGALGIGRVKEEGGFVIAQEPTEAEYPDMPQAAINTGLVDMVMGVAEIPAKLRSLNESRRRIRIPAEHEEVPSTEVDGASLREVLNLVRLRTGNDFSQYKRPTLLRRIARRMQVHEILDLSSYRSFLYEHPEEISALLRDLLITVTNFFRDPDSFEVLGHEAVPKLFEGKGRGDQVRVWSVGCATGEEAYSLAMLLAEYATQLTESPKIQIFATDIDENAISEARECHYPATIELDVSPERLRRFFTPDGDRYRVNKELREQILFAPHNVLRDPPFSKLDLISCRNLLIYFNREMQERVLGIFHFSLRENGYLFLGSSETGDITPALFAPVDKKRRIYIRRRLIGTAAFSPELPVIGKWQPKIPDGVNNAQVRHINAGELHQEVVEQIAPPSILVNEEYDIVHISAHAARYLRVAPGEPTRNLLKMVLPDLRLDLRAALLETRARREETPAGARRIRVKLDGETVVINLMVRPVLNAPEAARGFLLVIFDEMPEMPAGNEEPTRDSVDISVIRQLEQDLQQTKDQLRITIEQYETSTEELRASNEELQAINEELRSASEELETSKEELQSVNEELTTVNQEYREKIEEVGRANSDLQNLMASTDIGIIFLDRTLRIKLYTSRAQQLFNITPMDIGRPLEHFTHKLDYTRLTQDADEVLHSLQMAEREVKSSDGQWYLARLVPYRTVEDKIDGVVLNFVDITNRKLDDEKLEQQAEMLREADRNKDRFLAILAHELRNPLGVIFSSVDILERAGTNKTEAAQRAPAMIRRQLQQFVRLVDDLLDIERLSHGKIELIKKPVLIGDVIRSAVETCQPQVDSGLHQFTVQLSPEPVYVNGDLIRLTQVVDNLLSNAFKYTPAGGKIDVIGERVNNEAIIRVRDMGKGIDPKLLPQLFDMYSQAEPFTDSATKGLGIGLALVKWLVGLHQGTITASSEGPGKGAEFVVHLPVIPAPTAQAKTPATSPADESVASATGPASKKKMLLVDDNSDGVEALALLLTSEGHEVRAEHDGPGALEVAAEFRPDVAVVDLGLPGMDGFELAKKLREMLPSAQLIALSGWHRDQVEQRGLQLFDHYLRKPIEIHDLTNLLD
jgi:two-component system, chemotaxis family, CheB/CheR fusion protein